MLRKRNTKQILSCVDCTMVMRNVSFEHIRIKEANARVIYFGGGHYDVSAFSFDGSVDVRNTDGSLGVCTIINAEGSLPNPNVIGSTGNPCTVVLSGARAKPLDYTAATPADGGFIVLSGTALLLSGASNAFYDVLVSPNLPVYQQEQRNFWNANHGQAPPLGFGTYGEIRTFSDDYGQQMSAVVRLPDVRTTKSVTVGNVPAGGTKTVRVALGSPPPGQPRARPGDLVRLSTPAGFPDKLVVSGVVVVNDAVDVRVFNPTGAAVTVPALTWTLAVGGGPNAGAVQLLPPFPNPPVPL